MHCVVFRPTEEEFICSLLTLHVQAKLRQMTSKDDSFRSSFRFKSRRWHGMSSLYKLQKDGTKGFILSLNSDLFPLARYICVCHDVNAVTHACLSISSVLVPDIP